MIKMSVMHISRIQFKLEIENILSYHLTAKRNEHVYVSLKAVINNEQAEMIYSDPFIGDKIAIWGYNSSDIKEEILLFKGIIINLVSYVHVHAHYIELKCVSNTYISDRKEMDRSFQDINRTWKNILFEIMSNDANVIFCTEDKKTDFPMIQYHETNWQACIRIAGYCQTSVFPSYYTDNADIYFGLPKGMKREITRILKHKWFLSDNWYSACEHGNKDAYLILKIETYEMLNWGDNVNYENFAGKVIGCECRLEKGILIFSYDLGKESSVITNRLGNRKIKGAILQGRVLDTANDRVRLQLFIDNSQSAEDAYWYPWVPESGNMFYCMPEPGTQAALYIASDNEAEAYCLHNVRTNGESNPELKDSSHKYMTAAGKKRLGITSEKTFFDNQDKDHALTLGIYDNDKIEFFSYKEIGVFAEEQLSLKADNISIQAQSEISVIKKDAAFPAVINMCNSFDVLGNYGEITAAGSNAEVFPLKKSGNTNAYSISGQLGEGLSSATPAAGGENELEKCIAGAKVKRLYTNE